MAQRSNPLHNFSLPSLRWGNQRHLRCMKVNSNGEIVSSSDLSDRIDSRSSASDDSDEKKDLKFANQRSLITSHQPHSSSGLKLKLKSKIPVEEDQVFRERLLLHFQTEAEKTKFSNQEDESGAGVKPWNLRTRRAVCKAPNGESSKLDEQRRSQQQQQQHNVTVTPNKTENPSPKSLRLKGLAATDKKESKERRKLSATLSRDEIKDDFLILTGNSLPRRLKKRPKTIQKQLDNLLPGLWLTEITVDSYKIADEVIETKKK